MFIIIIIAFNNSIFDTFNEFNEFKVHWGFWLKMLDKLGNKNSYKNYPKLPFNTTDSRYIYIY